MLGMFRLLVLLSVFCYVGCGGSNTGVEAPENPSPPPSAPPQGAGVQPPPPPSVN